MNKEKITELLNKLQFNDKDIQDYIDGHNTKSIIFDNQRKVGCEIIYDEQKICGDKIIDIFTKQGGPPLLIAQMQQGKTGVCIYVIDQFINMCESHGLKYEKDYEVIYLTNISDNDLTGQVQDRIRSSGLEDKVKVIHHAGLKTFVLNTNINKRLIIIDECHVALEKDRPFDTFLKSFGIDYGNSIDAWQVKDNYVLSVSATPYAQIIRNKIDDKSFEPVVLEVNDEYFSLQKMRPRIEQSCKIVDGQRASPFFQNKMARFLNDCKDFGPGYMVARSTGKKANILKDYVQNNYPAVGCAIYSSEEGNIGKINDVLSSEIPKPYVVIIKGCLRAGKTLKTTKNIRMWIEPPKSMTDTVCQAIGRCCGYPGSDNHTKDNDKFPIYCNEKELEVAIDFFKNMEAVPSGRNNKTNISQKSFEIIICEKHELPQTDEYFNNKTGSIKRTLVSGQKTDLIDIILNDKWHFIGTNTPILHIDKPNEKYIKSFQKLQEKYPNKDFLSGKYFAYKNNLEISQIIGNSSELISDKCLLNK